MPSNKKYTVKNRIKIKGKTMKRRNTRKNTTRKIHKRLLKFPKAFLKKIQKKSSLLPEECPICYDDPMTKENTQTLNCGHKFHKRCIKKWKRGNNAKCPMCRGSIQSLSPDSQISSIASNGSNRHNFIDLGDVSDYITFNDDNPDDFWERQSERYGL